MHILVVDDEAEILEEVAEYLKWRQWRVHTARNITEALAHLRADDQVSVVLSDIKMPGGSGFDLLTQARSLLTRCPAFILMSGHTSNFDSEQRLEQGAAAIIEKPISLDRLELELENALACTP